MYPMDLLFSRFFAGQKGIISTSGEYQIWNSILDSDIDASILVYGTSRAAINLDNVLMSKKTDKTSFNLGYFGGNISSIYLRHLLFSRYHPKPEMVIFSLDLGLLARETRLFHEQTYYPYMLWDQDFREATAKYQNFSRYDYLMPLYRYMGTIHYIDRMTEDEDPKYNPYYFGYRPLNKTWGNSSLDSSKYIVDLDPMSIDIFERMIQNFRKEGIEVILVMTPMHISKQYEIEDNRTVMQLYNKLARKYEMLFLDYSVSDISKDTANFFDGSHCSTLGAQKTTEKLFVDLHKLGYISPASSDGRSNPHP